MTAKHLFRAVVSLGGLSFGVFILPYLFPPASAILSASSLAGFNNSLAYAWYVGALVLAAYALAGQVSGDGAREAFEGTGPLFVAPPVAVIAVMAAHLGLFVALYARTHGFVFGEPLYFQDAAYRMHAGSVPFVDFVFFYGPLLISPVVFLAGYVGIPAAYGIYYVASYLAGLYLLYVVLAALLGRKRQLVAWYCVFAIGFFNPITGLNYTLGRFLLPIVTLLASWRCYQAPSTGRWLGAVALMTAAFLCSPDIAVVALASVLVLCGLLCWIDGRDRRLTTSAAVLAGIPVGALVLAGGLMRFIDGTWRPLVGYLRPIVTFSAGGWNTPIDPSLPALALIAATVLTVARLWRAWRDCRGTRLAALLAAYGVMVVLMQRAGLGKADVVHLAFSGLPAFLPAAAWTLPKAGPRPLRWMTALLIVGVVGPLQFYHAMLFVPSLLQRWTRPAVSASGAGRIPAPPTRSEIQASLAKAVEHFGTGQLYYMHRLEYFRLPIYLRYQLKPFLYHPSLTSAFTSEDIAGVIQSLRQSGVTVLARRSDLTASGATPIPTHWWYYVTSSPLPGSEVYNLTLEFQARLEAPLVQFLNSEYDVAFEDGEIVGLVRRGTTVAKRDPADHAGGRLDAPHL
jgi:hypothetical protein